METAGYLASHWEESQAEHRARGPRRRLYRITTEGQTALRCFARRRQRAKACGASCAIVTFLSVVSSWIARAWVWLFTLSMPPELRDRQREERAAHVCDHIAHSTASGQTPLRAASDLVWALVVGLPADIVFAISSSARFVQADPNKEDGPELETIASPYRAVAVSAVAVVMIQTPEHVRQNSHLLAVRWSTRDRRHRSVRSSWSGLW